MCSFGKKEDLQVHLGPLVDSMERQVKYFNRKSFLDSPCRFPLACNHLSLLRSFLSRKLLSLRQANTHKTFLNFEKIGRSKRGTRKSGKKKEKVCTVRIKQFCFCGKVSCCFCIQRLVVFQVSFSVRTLHESVKNFVSLSLT